MSDPAAPTNDPVSEIVPPPEHSDPTGGGFAKLALVVGGSIVLAILIIAILLPALGRARSHPPAMYNTNRVRGIVQGLVVYAGGNKEKMPGLTSKGYILKDDGTDDSFTGKSGHGATVEARFWLLLDNNAFLGEYIISPVETKAVWTTGKVSSANYSFALLNIHSDGGMLLSDTTRPDQTGRSREWKQSINTQAVLVSDRARIPGGHIGDDYDKIYSVHTDEDDEQWVGSIARGDGSASFENEEALDTKYGSGSEIEYDRLFASQQSSDPRIDVLKDKTNPWDDKSNALLGYTSVGYKDGDIASD
ncbi:MAG: hypothetical protein R3C45_14020 [Phycisphaerales bacterium]